MAGKVSLAAAQSHDFLQCTAGDRKIETQLTPMVSLIFDYHISPWRAMTDNDLFDYFADFLLHNRTHLLSISITGLFARSQTRALALLYILDATRQLHSSLFQRSSPAFHRASFRVRSRTACCHRSLHRRYTQRFPCCKCNKRLFAHGRSELRNLQSSDESCRPYFYGK